MYIYKYKTQTKEKNAYTKKQSIDKSGRRQHDCAAAVAAAALLRLCDSF